MLGVDAVVSGGALYVIDLGRVNAGVLGGAHVDYDYVMKNLVMRNPGAYSSRSYSIEEGCGTGEVLDHNPEGIPASEVKGMLRTAYLYWLLKGDAERRRLFFEEVREAVGGASPRRLNRLSVNAEAGVMRERVVRTFEEEERVFERDVFNKVLVRQLTKPSTSDYGVYCIRDLEGRYQVMAIGLRPGVEVSYEIKVGIVRKDEALENALVKALSEFSSDISAFEIGRNVKLPSCDNGFVVRIGYGAGRRWKTVITLLERFDRGLYEEVTRLMSSYLGKPWGDSTIRLAKGQVVGVACIRVVP
ncbi:CRISPR-associated RAMP protein, Csm5 family [Vulcanisaeta moutnovskia 768-28]|uniref:CRISPR-associated RAMP protein, Csm5 family n=1 Tax=Vulcanisaeta moutnovskia (strain 768-28) TaxID=985053 RepID=F0QTI0_VULM7|nr:CRISPR-associated RAMP protein, Csm5 family [Vulcanisaeta moutnovskia 768-28]